MICTKSCKIHPATLQINCIYLMLRTAELLIYLPIQFASASLLSIAAYDCHLFMLSIEHCDLLFTVLTIRSVFPHITFILVKNDKSCYFIFVVYLFAYPCFRWLVLLLLLRCNVMNVISVLLLLEFVKIIHKLNLHTRLCVLGYLFVSLTNYHCCIAVLVSITCFRYLSLKYIKKERKIEKCNLYILFHSCLNFIYCYVAAYAFFILNSDFND